MTATTVAPVAAPAARPWLVFAAVSLCTFQTSLSLSIMNVAFPTLRDAFPGTSASALSWVINLYTIVAAASLVITGVLGERLGRKRLLLIGVAGFAVCSVVCALARNVTVLLVFRALQALASAFVTPVAASLIARAFPEGGRATAVASWSAVGSVAVAAGPTVGAVLVDWGGWPWAFWINLPGGFAGFVLAAIVIRESKDPEPRPIPDLLGAVLVATSVAAVIGSLTQSRTWGWSDWRVPALLAVGIALGGALVARSRRHPEPILDVALFRVANFRLANLASLCFGLGFFAMFFAFVLFLRDVWGYNVRDAGLLMTPVPVCGAILSPFMGWASGRFGVHRLGIFGGGAVAAGAAWLLVAIDDTPDLGTWIPAMTIVGIGAAAMWPCIFGGVVLGTPPERFAVATGINQTVQRISTALGVALTIAIVGDTARVTGMGNFRVVFALLCGAGLAGAVIGSRFRAPARLER